MSSDPRKPKLLVISAPSGAGKTTLCARLLKEFGQLTLSISSTTRAPRGQERDGVEYHFLSVERFRSMIDAGAFAEWAEVHGNYYGTSRQVILDAFAQGRSVLLDIDVQGADQLRRSFPQDCVTIFVSPPDEATLEKRLRERGTDGEETILKRMRNARAEMAQAERFDRIVINDELERAYSELRAFVQDAIGAPARPGARD